MQILIENQNEMFNLFLCLQVDSGSSPSGYIPLHLACLTGKV